MLLSTLQHLDAAMHCIFHLYLKDFTEKDIQLLHATLQDYRDRVQLLVKDVDSIDLGSGKGISGNKMTYAIFAAFDQDESDHIIWVDADMIVLADLAEVWQPLCASGKSALVIARNPLSKAHHMERTVMQKYGMRDEDLFFNAAFVAVNSAKYRAMNGYKRALEFIEKHPEQSDQGAMNYLFMNDFDQVDAKFNTPYWPHNREPDLKPKDIICHFIGSPKPWDLFGDLLHPSFPIFKQWISRTAYASSFRWRYSSLSAWKRFFRISYKYWPLLKSRFKA